MKNIYLICGIPGCGKDWYVENIIPASVVVSFDNIRIALYKRDNDCKEFNNTIELYNKAWAYCNSKRIDLMIPLVNKVKTCFDKGLTPCICNTLLTRKSRASMINVLKSNFTNTNIHCIFLTVDSKTALERNANRTTHRLSEDVMMRFINGPQELPSCIEGFETVKVVHNG